MARETEDTGLENAIKAMHSKIKQLPRIVCSWANRTGHTHALTLILGQKYIRVNAEQFCSTTRI